MHTRVLIIAGAAMMAFAGLAKADSTIWPTRWSMDLNPTASPSLPTRRAIVAILRPDRAVRSPARTHRHPRPILQLPTPTRMLSSVSRNKGFKNGDLLRWPMLAEPAAIANEPLMRRRRSKPLAAPRRRSWRHARRPDAEVHLLALRRSRRTPPRCLPDGGSGLWPDRRPAEQLVRTAGGLKGSNGTTGPFPCQLVGEPRQYRLRIGDASERIGQVGIIQNRKSFRILRKVFGKDEVLFSKFVCQGHKATVHLLRGHCRSFPYV